MSGRSRHILALWIAILAAQRLSAQQPEVDAQVDRSNIYLGDTVVYVVDVRNVEDAPAPTLAIPDGCKVEPGEVSSLDSSSVTIINGRVTQRSSFGRRFSYRITPTAGGDVEIGSPAVTIDGREIRGPRVRLRVVEPQEQDYVILHSRIERTGRYPLQPFTITLRLFVRAAPPPYSGKPPLELLTNAPSLDVPWGREEPPDGLRAESLSTWLNPLVARSQRGEAPGFHINDITPSRSPFSIFDQPRMLVFDLGGRKATEEDVADVERLVGKSHRYYVYELTREFEPRRSGTFELQPTSVKGTFVSGARNGRLQGEPVFDLGGGATVVVDEPPLEGRPASWSGAFGSRFELSAELAPTRVRVGDPMALTLSLRGRGNVEEIRPPDLAADAAMTERFRVQDPTRDVVDGRALFTYSLRPVSAEVTGLPAIPFSYFDLDKERYVTVHSDPVGVVVDRIDSLSGGDIVTGEVGGSRRDVSRADGLFGNITDPREVTDDRVHLARHGAFLGGLAVAYLGLALLLTRRRRLRDDPLRVRRREARSRAMERVAAAEQQLASGALDDGAGQLREAFGGLVSAAAGVPEAGITVREVDEHLDRIGVADDLRDRVASILEACDGLRYGGGAPSVLDLRPAETLRELAEALRSRGTLR